ncbi:MAG: glycoside hydrolase family 3 C-terminal domain-containing protein [Streptosporangiaceae bacterium]|nr:glycoside hydrolase family 3 C-terminal domain-containing protein [Streptosporangiaceae bacterium]
MTQAAEDELSQRVGKLTLEQKVRLLTGADFWSLHAEPAVGLRRLVMSDGPAGVRGETWDERDPSASIPSPTALAATWDVSRVRAIGRLLAYEARRKGVDVVLAPTVNLHRTPYAGRHFECFSEDPLLTGALGVAYVRGLQEDGVGACVKHFVCNDSETQRMTVDVRIDDRVLHELYLAPFEAIVREGAVWSVMAAYNGVNGHSMTESPLLRDILHGEWGFDGVVVSDWTAARSAEPAARAALDLAMPGPAETFGPWGDALVTAVRSGAVDEALLDDKVLRILRLAYRTGALDPATSLAEPVGPDIVTTLRETAAASFVLVRNEGNLLPLPPRARGRVPVAVIGPNAALARTMGGGSATVSPQYTFSPVDGLRVNGVDVRYAAGVYGHGRVPAATTPWQFRPDGVTPGAEIRFFAASGELLGSQQRGTGSWTWMNGFGSYDSVARLEIHSVIKATTGGTYRLGVSALGRVRLLARGVELFDVELALSEDADPAEIVMFPPQHIVPVELADAEAVPVVVEYDVTSSPLGGFVTSLQFNLEEPHGTDDEEIARAVALARSSEYAVVVVGTTAQTESEGFDRKTLALPGRQDDLVRAVAAANPRTIVVVNSGAPVLMPWVDEVPAVLLTWFGGQEYGNALADVLLGAAEPGGRLPTTWPVDAHGLPSPEPADGVLRYGEGLFTGYRAYDRDGRRPLFAFGHGLGYTTWSYESINVDHDAVVSVTLRNTGRRRGREVVQVYASRPDSAIERPVKWLAGFATVDARPGETVTVRVAIPARAFQHWTPDHGWVTEPGRFTLAAGPSSATSLLTATVVR